jgi:hypothetical protein
MQCSNLGRRVLLHPQHDDCIAALVRLNGSKPPRQGPY